MKGFVSKAAKELITKGELAVIPLHPGACGDNPGVWWMENPEDKYSLDNAEIEFVLQRTAEYSIPAKLTASPHIFSGEENIRKWGAVVSASDIVLI